MLEDRETAEEMRAALGIAVVACWERLPKDVQQILYEAAVASRGDGFRGALSLYLHDHNPRTANAHETALPDDEELPLHFPPTRKHSP